MGFGVSLDIISKGAFGLIILADFITGLRRD
jgi:hypothetical protein